MIKALVLSVDNLTELMLYFSDTKIKDLQFYIEDHTVLPWLWTETDTR